MRTFDQYFFNREDELKGYVHDNFKISGFVTNSFKSTDGNIARRMHNMLVSEVNDKHEFPKFIVIVLADDLITFLNQKFGFENQIHFKKVAEIIIIC